MINVLKINCGLLPMGVKVESDWSRKCMVMGVEKNVNGEFNLKMRRNALSTFFALR